MDLFRIRSMLHLWLGSDVSIIFIHCTEILFNFPKPNFNRCRQLQSYDILLPLRSALEHTIRIRALLILLSHTCSTIFLLSHVFSNNWKQKYKFEKLPNGVAWAFASSKQGQGHQQENTSRKGKNTNTHRISICAHKSHSTQFNSLFCFLTMCVFIIRRLQVNTEFRYQYLCDDTGWG